MKDDKGYRLDYGRKKSAGKIREFFGNVPQVLKAYAWLLAMGRDGIDEASDISVLANNYMDHKLAKIRGLSRSNPHIAKHRMEMTRWSLGQLKTDTGCGTVEVANRMADYGIDPWWMSHEPWIVPEPFTPEAGEMYSKEDLDYWIAVVARISEEAYANPELVKSAPHKQAIAQIKGDALNDPAKWAITWRAYLRKHGKGGQARRQDPRRRVEAGAPVPTGADRQSGRRDGRRVGLKGTDNLSDAARQLGAEPVSEARTLRALRRLGAARGSIAVLAAGGAMGATVAAEAGLLCQVVAQPAADATTADDSANAARAMVSAGVDLILFAGGDGTARDIHAIAGERVPMLGIPTGVKMQSAIFATSPEAAGDLVAAIVTMPDRGKLQYRSSEVMDIDEEALRRGAISPRLFGYATVPYIPLLLQNAKVRNHGLDEAALEAAAQHLAAGMDGKTLYAIGPAVPPSASSRP